MYLTRYAIDWTLVLTGRKSEVDEEDDDTTWLALERAVVRWRLTLSV